MAQVSSYPLWRVVRHELPENPQPREAATLVLKRLKISSPPIEIEKVVKSLGVQIVPNPRLGFSGTVHSTTNSAVITVNTSESGVRQRFTIAHELAHLLFDKIGQQYRDHNFANPPGWIEKRANEFAASLFIPLWMLEPIATARRQTTEQLANAFEVSIPAMNHQLRKLVNYW